MRKRGRAILASTLLAAGCQQSAQHELPAPVNAVASSASALWRDPVTAQHYARRVLYTWTTTAQIEALRRDRSRLLVREHSPDFGASFYEQVVAALADRGDVVAKLLHTTTFAKSRFAWPAPWATREGWGDEEYGDQLIRVTLRSNAIVLALSTATGGFEARDLDGAVVSLAEVSAHPERIGAVYFVTDLSRPLAPGVPQPASSYREYVLCNEAMIASWSTSSRDIADELAAEVGALEALANELRRGPPSHDTRAGYASALAFSANDNYRLDLKTIERIAFDLRLTPKQLAIEGGGDAVWPGIGPQRTLPPRRFERSTFARGTY